MQEKPLSIALREIDAGLLTSVPISPDEVQAVADVDNGIAVVADSDDPEA